MHEVKEEFLKFFTLHRICQQLQLVIGQTADTLFIGLCGEGSSNSAEKNRVNCGALTALGAIAYMTFNFRQQ